MFAIASEYLKWKYRDVKPDEKRELTPRERRANWWFYHKWHVALGILLALIAGNLIHHALTNRPPDIQVAWVSSAPLPEETARALEDSLSGLAGGASVAVRQYLTVSRAEDPLMAQAAGVQLMADLDACGSYFFLLEDPEGFQRDAQVLRCLDGSLPREGEAAPAAYAWTDCPVLRDLPLGDWTQRVSGLELTGEGQALMEDMYLARRGFWPETKKTCANPELCDSLWAALTEGAAEP